MDIEPGQIWEVNSANGRTGKVLIFATQSNFANTFSVWDTDAPNNYCFSCGGSVDTRKMIYTVYDNLLCLIDTIGESEMEEIKHRFATSVGISVDDEEYIPPVTNVATIERERDIWKSVANKLLDSLKR